MEIGQRPEADAYAAYGALWVTEVSSWRGLDVGSQGRQVGAESF